ncbi:glycosyltransferase EpsD [Thermacetogenium phaeum DSM 12270]|uniref:Glycosyltransferase EpsD n=1 Tax=Thermacetogenium phaeum (strain ATCC BAA-254 / DSM 26808 / PB) TaxID=1089553 RepID=K4LCP1_THEPS|nr:glycosyltransferase family 4 protein [Thermacetogenium phaeum]AFV10528.1 glycosyltransferase EpsD [Thermacetogenium phaeum DSM 12270]
MTQRRVLFLATVYTHLAAFHVPFMKMLQGWGCEVHAAASSAEGHKERVEEAGVICWEIPFARSPYSPANLDAYRCLKALLREHRFDLIHVHTPVAAFLGRYLAKKTGQGPVLYTAHGFHFYKGAPWKNWLIYYTAERLAAVWTDGLIVMNGEDYENARRMGFEPDKNLFYVHGVGVDLRSFEAPPAAYGIRRELGIEASDVVVSCVAEMIPRKNHDFLLEAWKGVAAGCFRCHLLLVGTGKLKSHLEEKVKREQIPRVHFLGFRRNVPEILRESNIITLTSKHEGLPRCVMEAMAAGKPVVVTDVRGSRDLVEDGRTGFLVRLGDAAGLAAALERLARDPELRTSMGAAGREKIREYSLERVLAEMAEVYGRYLR